MRSNKLVLPADPVDEELARDWTLSEIDKAEVRHCRGDNNRRRFALQLCTLRNYGRFLDDSEVVPVRILNHLSCQLEAAGALCHEPGPRRHGQRTRAAYTPVSWLPAV